MKRNNILKLMTALLITIILFGFDSSVKAEEEESRYFRAVCETEPVASGNTRYQHTCKLYLKSGASELTSFNTIQITLENMVKLELNTVVEADGWTKRLVTNAIPNNPVYSFTAPKPLSQMGEVLFATYIFDVIDDGVGCKVEFVAEFEQINTYKCQKVGNVYYGPEGTEVSYDDYVSLCKPYKCQKVGDNYYDAEGNKVSEKEYNIACKKYNCQIVDGKYYNASGEEVNEEAYIAACKPYKCEQINDKYYDDEGNLVTADVFREKCAPKCKQVGNTYFDDQGNQVTQEVYIEKCTKPTCQKVGDNYFDKDGNKVTEEKYKESCNPKCKKVDGKYYDNKGNEVTEEKYTELCEALPDNPKTGLSLSIAFLVIVTITSVFMYSYTKKENKLYK